MRTGRGIIKTSVWIKVGYAVPWLVVLGWILWTDFDNFEAAVVIMLQGAITVAAAPISFVAVGVFSIIEEIVPDRVKSGVSLQQFFKGFLLIWWTLMFALSYWQWFYLVPKCVRIFQRWRNNQIRISAGEITKLGSYEK